MSVCQILTIKTFDGKAQVRLTYLYQPEGTPTADPAARCDDFPVIVAFEIDVAATTTLNTDHGYHFRSIGCQSASMSALPVAGTRSAK